MPTHTPPVEALESRRLLAAFTVTTTADAGAGSLRAALAAADANGQADTIAFSPTLSGGTIALASQLAVTETEPLTITGPASGITLSGGNTTRILRLGVDTDVTIDGLRFVNGNGRVTGTTNTPSANGGAINAIEGGTRLSVLNSTFTGNVAENGGAINLENGDLLVQDSTFTNNTANATSPQRPDGGAIRAIGTLTISGSSITDNQAVGVINAAGDPDSRGGGVYFIGPDTAPAGESGGAATPTVLSKSASAGHADLAVGGETDLLRANDDGGGFEGTLPGTSYDWSRAPELLDNAVLTILNSDIDDNTASDLGGGLAAFDGGDATNQVFSPSNIVGTSISGNRLVGPDGIQISGGGFFVDGGPFLFKDSLIAENDTTVNATDGFGGGGSFQLVEQVTFVNTTVTNNTSANRGGLGFGLFGGADLGNGQTIPPINAFYEFIQTTVTDNQSNGLVFQGAGNELEAIDTIDLVLYNSVVSGNRDADGVVPDDSQADLPDNDPNQDFGNDFGIAGGLLLPDPDAIRFFFRGPNLVGTQFSPGPDSEFVSTNFPQLEPLADNGGLTRTRLPEDGSPVVDAGNNDFAVDPGPDIIVSDDDLFTTPPPDDDTPLAFDQRGPGFPRISGGQVDLGAAELQDADTNAPTVDAIDFQFLNRQAVAVTFSEDVSGSLSVADLIVTNLTTGQTFVPTAVTYDAASNTATFTFGSGAVLPRGNYTAVLPAGSVEDAAGNELADDVSISFFVLPGDANRDRRVNLSDFTVLANNFGRTSGVTFAQGDFNYDGRVNLSDFTILANNFGNTLPAPDGDGEGLFGGGDDDDEGKGGLI